MNVACPECDSVYRVDPGRVPENGVRARCSTCGGVIVVGVPGAANAAAGTAAAVGARPEARDAETERVSSAPLPAPAGSSDATTGAAAATEGAADAAPPPSDQPDPGDVDEPSGRSAPVFGAAQDPDVRAERIARALVSDIVVYNADRRDASLQANSLRSDFKEEILKSWEEYVEQVGLEMARGSPYFRDALNSILAKGRDVF